MDLFRARPTRAALVLEDLVADGAEIAVTEPVVMEVLAGAVGDALDAIRAQLVALPVLRVEGLADFEEAARIYRACRASGDTLRNQIDCLIAVPAIRHGASLLSSDGDFAVIARHSGLKLHPASA